MITIPPIQKQFNKQKKERRDKILLAIGRWRKLSAVIIVAIGSLIWIGIIQPLTRDKNMQKATTTNAGQVICSSDAAKINTFEYKKHTPIGLGMYTKNPAADTSSADVQYQQMPPSLKTGDSKVDAALKEGYASSGNLQLIACITQEDIGDSGKTCKVMGTQSPIYNTKNTIQLIESRTHKVIAEETIDGAKPGEFSCETSEDVVIDYKQQPVKVYAPADKKAFAEFVGQYL